MTEVTKEGVMRQVAVSMGIALTTLAFGITNAHAQNTAFGTSVHLLVGQGPVAATITQAEPTRYYDAPVVAGRSYCAEAATGEQEVNEGAAVLALFHANQLGISVTDTGATAEPKGLGASRLCFIATQSETVFVSLTDSSPTASGITYNLRLVETTLWTNWFFVSGDYSSWTLLRNTTSSTVHATITWRNAGGNPIGGGASAVIQGNGIYVVDARTNQACPFPTACLTLNGSVEVAHDGPPDAIVGSQTTLSGTTGLSFDTIFFQRHAW